MSNTLILALGNPLRGDDGVGLAVLQALETASLPSEVVLQDGGTPGLETVLLIQDYARVMIVDAAEMQLAPGMWRSFSPEQVCQHCGVSSTLHSAGLAEALLLGEAMGILPEQIVIYGIQPHEIGWEPGLSGAVQAAIPDVAAAILHSLCLAVR